MAYTLVITNGDCAVERLTAAGITARILPWRDVLHDGPVPRVSPDELASIRASYLCDGFGNDRGDVTRAFAERDAVLASHADFGRVEVWLEHDLYDQLQLLQILDRLASLGRSERVWLVQADDYLGTMGEDAVRALAPRAAPVSPAQFNLGRLGWAAFTAPTPEDLAKLLSHDLAPLPWLRPALIRLLAELPDRVTALALSETRILEALEDGVTRPGRLFAAVSAREEARFMGDTSFFRLLDGLAFAHEPLVSGLPARFPHGQNGSYETAEAKAYLRADVRATAFGAEVLAGRADHARANPIDRWLGGTHLTSDGLWRWNGAAQALIAPA